VREYGRTDDTGFGAPSHEQSDEDISGQFLLSSETFSTRGLRGADRVEKWERHNARALLGLAAKSIDEDPLDATEINLHLPSLHLAHVSANAHVIERTAAHIRKTPADSIVMYFALYGDAFFYHRDGVRNLSPGTAILWDTDRPFMRGFAKGLKELVLVVPKPLFAEITNDATPHRGDPFVSSFGTSRHANEFTTQIATTMSDAIREPGGRGLVETEREVVDLLRGHFGGASATGASTQFRLVSRIAQRHLRDPALSATVLANLAGVSPRQLSRILSGGGYTLPVLLLELRLELAMRVLLSERGQQMKISDVATYCGFSSLPHFSRAFRAHYGFSPSSVDARQDAQLRKFA
jgi:AraC-like DNA-binding protein